MALPDLTGINIENSYQRVVQTDGTYYYDGTGSLLNIGGTINTGSFATTGSNTFRGSQIITGSLNTNNTLYVSASRVGIGISTPTATLDVSGSVRVTNNAVITGSLIVAQGANVILSTGTSTLSRLGITSVDWRTRTLNNSDGNVVVDWNNNQVYDILGSSSIDWEGRVLNDPDGLLSVDYGTRRLRNSTNDVTLNWETGDLAGTASYATQALSASYAPGTPAFPFVGSAQVTGSLSVSGSVIINNVDIQSTIVAMAIALG